MKKRVLITTVPFGDKNRLPLELLEAEGIEYTINPIGRKVTEQELLELISGYEAVIAGTEIISKRVLKEAVNLKLISRVGVGLDGVDLNYARKRNILVCYTPEAPAPAVAELTIGLMLSLLRSVHTSNLNMHRKIWERRFGRRIPEVTIGIIGTGRIGGRVLRRLAAFGSPRVLVNDLNADFKALAPSLKLEAVDKNTLFEQSDIISVHVPLTPQTKNMICVEQLNLMKNDAFLINVSRGGIVNENDLYQALTSGNLAGAAIDVFDEATRRGGGIGNPIFRFGCFFFNSIDCFSSIKTI